MKDYKNWTTLKTRLNNTPAHPIYHEGDICWVCLGENIGYEQDGKGKLFIRPVLVLKKFNRELFLGLSLTSKQKVGKYYSTFSLKGKTSTAILSQIRTMDSSRISGRRLGIISRKDFRSIKEKIISLIK